MIKLLRFSAFNLALGYVALSIALLTLFATPLGMVWRKGINEARTQYLQQDVQRLADIFTKDGVEGLIAAINRYLDMPFVPERTILLADASLSRIAGNLSTWPSEVPDSPGAHELSIKHDGVLTQVVVIHAILPGANHLLVGREISRFKKLELLFWYGLATTAVTVLLLGWLGGTLIRRALLAEVKGIGKTAAAIVDGDLSRRLPLLGGRDELDLLTQTINRMLDQIEHLVHGVRNVSNAIAHDLRTPLAELRSRLEELSVTRPSPEETFTEIDGAVADIDRVMGIFNALLRLAEIDSGARRSGFVQVNLTQIASDAAEFYQPVAEVKGVKLSFTSSGELYIAGDPLLLAQAIGNLIDNALKYARDRGTVEVRSLLGTDGTIEVCVSDDGPGIPDNEKSKVTERFYRGDASRVTSGTGLGLSLVEAVAKLHGASLAFTDNNPGLRATLIFTSRVIDKTA